MKRCGFSSLQMACDIQGYGFLKCLFKRNRGQKGDWRLPGK
ncbi:hypothetical protein ABNB59_05395 [Paenibacillus larvae]|uniref:Uncharacterized protein n=1 Tax=Paenibacillus larvae TaxID=1464 RepID=A0AAP5JXF6_9BACL|nr:hypothetical protein [Paenibacillus larvae]AVG11993.1 hypothetical protein ERICII_01593 [Paenibacillus larvae subsp. larvae DSM 25430]MDE5126079.1 hypothetical protein [Paenibacillus larvae subsp. larvae]MDE5133411.1 hypothetical protein [Paenibacillus larvae subsp. larvae]MDE5137636.1 hypothetical protein [Paenibacillus larvae subsp. larvae]MDE5141803.1 hypothetical protein [Paenibacillus larvae subsp. larvae]